MPSCIAPSEITLVVHDEYGSPQIEAMWQGHRVGHAWCTVGDDGRMALADLKLETVHLRRPVAHSPLILLGVTCRTRDFRGQGVGRMLMQRVLSEARAMGIREVWGSVTQEDIDGTPYLLEWYRRLGFTVMAPDGECIGSAVKRIMVRLQQEPR